ncbi:MAG: hypothetical protein ACOYYS_12215 [Chloroflexota bacterium]
MPENPTLQSSAQSSSPVGHLRQEYETQQALFDAQPALVQRFLEAQARQLADAITQHASQVRFSLPDRVVPVPGGQPEAVPANQREQAVGKIIDRLTGSNLQVNVRQRLMELESAGEAAVAAGGNLLRHATVSYMVRSMLPAGRSVVYTSADGEEIPSIPASRERVKESAITAVTDAIAEEGAMDEAERGELLVPYVEYARRFYLPQWVAFDDEDRLLVNSVGEAEAHVQSMQRFLGILHAAVYLAPYMVADDEYQQKRYGMLGQIVNQGRALARYQVREIVATIKRRAAAHELNRGLSLSLPFFDDQDLEMKMHAFQVIPAGRIMFVPAFVVRAAREEQAKVAQDTRLNPSTRKHLLVSLKMLEDAFIR